MPLGRSDERQESRSLKFRGREDRKGRGAAIISSASDIRTLEYKMLLATSGQKDGQIYRNPGLHIAADGRKSLMIVRAWALALLPP